MAALDFTTALARLLADGRTRDAFASDAPALLAEWNVAEADHPALLALPVADLEMQAVTLLRKKFAVVNAQLPETCRRLGALAWLEFHAYARLSAQPTLAGFLDHLPPAAVNFSEVNRVRYRTGTERYQAHWVRDWPARGRLRWAVQLFWRQRECVIFFGL